MDRGWRGAQATAALAFIQTSPLTDNGRRRPGAPAGSAYSIGNARAEQFGGFRRMTRRIALTEDGARVALDPRAWFDIQDGTEGRALIDGDRSDDDTDGDGIPDFMDPDDDGDGIPTSEEDYDHDGDPASDDSDGDGIRDKEVNGERIPFEFQLIVYGSSNEYKTVGNIFKEDLAKIGVKMVV